MAIELEKLNNEQKEAVTHEDGPLLIVAGAGTGKTTVITQRIAYLIEKGLATPEEMLALTFTEKAASEMEERVDRLVQIGYTDIWVSTFHAFCERILREHALDIGLANDFKVIDGTAAWMLFRQHLDTFRFDYYQSLGNPTRFIQALLSHISRCKDQEISPEDYLNYAESLPEDEESQRLTEVANAYKTYQQLLLDNNYLDFGDLINYCLRLFKKRPKILEKYQNKFKYILVDEFQDTNWAQYELVKLLAEPRNNLTVCADDDQAIYRWRGASFSNILQFSKDFPKAKQVSLVNNYRSNQEILDKAYQFIIQNNPDRLEFKIDISKKLISNSKGTGIVEHISADTLDGECLAVAEKIQQLISDEEIEYNDIAVLVRANDHALPFIKTLERAGIPYQFLASRGLYAKPVILDIISYFKLLDNYHESSACYRVLNLPSFKITSEDIIKISYWSHKKTQSLFESLQQISIIPGISKSAKQNVTLLLSIIKKHTELAKTKPVSALLIAFLHDSEYIKELIEHDDRDQLFLIDQLYKKIKTFEESNLDPSLKHFISQLTMELEAGEEGKLAVDQEQGLDMVKIMTIHGAKGLEFKHVFIVSMVDKRFPSIGRSEAIELPEALIKEIQPSGDAHLQEERRLCYVAMTRAKHGLYFTSASDYGGARKKKISKFLAEMGFKDSVDTTKPNKKNLLEKQEEPLEKKQHFVYSPDHFSYSQISCYEKCPLQYKYQYVLKIPMPGKAVFSFGRTIHTAFQQFALLALHQQGEHVPFTELEKLYEKHWIDEWFDSKKQKEEYKKAGKRIIKNFYDDFYSRDEKNPDILQIKDSVGLELPFKFKIGQDTMYGKIDRIDDAGDGVEIVDYKTGKAKDKLSPEDREQLLIYQMAALELGLNPVKLTYYYVDDNKKISFLGSDKELELLREKLAETIQAIKKGEFEPKQGHDCQYCDYRELYDIVG